MNRVDCTTPGCGNSEPFDGAHPEGWVYVLAAPAPPKYVGKCKFFRGMCPACQERAKRQPVKCPGGVEFRPEKWGDSADEKPRQKSLFGDE